MRVAGETVCGRALQGSSQPHICSAVFVVPDVKGIFSIILILFSLSGLSMLKFPVSLRNRLISTGLEMVLSHTKKSCMASYYRPFLTNVKIKIIKLLPAL